MVVEGIDDGLQTRTVAFRGFALSTALEINSGTQTDFAIHHLINGSIQAHSLPISSFLWPSADQLCMVTANEETMGHAKSEDVWSTRSRLA